MSKDRSILRYRGERCLNCDLPIERSDKYCPNCGQLNSTKKLSFDDFFSEFFSGVFAYDSRFQRTLRVLLFKPGKISKDYIEGKRMRYANPFRFYLSASILFFLIFGSVINLDEEFTESGAPSAVEIQDQTSITVANNKPAINDSIDFHPELIAKSIEEEKDSLNYRNYLITKADLDSLNRLELNIKKFWLFYEFQEETKVRSSEKAMECMDLPKSKFNLWFYKKAVDAGTFKENPKLFIEYFIGKLPFIIFFYLPVFAFFIYLLYLRRRFSYMEHLIFAFHVQTMFFILYAIAFLIKSFTDDIWAISMANLIFLIYLYKGMRSFYGQGRVKTILKFLILNLIFLLLAVIAAIIALLVSFSIY
ncbi:DUF3667 domain-containing protein [Christiangramia salexigens]|uniref:DUF3667 domain-containing protein n=1 Tax=Christiangramia salexigens TaxID=1913577 RepID=A0A1L3J532_9FLAO|nr:DUF3667 domain-containing protein [Christiangramia salexigens]APG60213.1 hypothetical protein LPB144_07235 [Christiangramia salexigens]